MTALVVMADGTHADTEDLRAHCRARLAGFKVPKVFEPVTDLPRTPSGKLRRSALR